MRFGSFFKANLHWNEPEAFLLLQDHESKVYARAWLRPLGFGVWVILMLLGWWISRHNPTKHPPDFWVMLPLTLIFGSVLFYGYPWFLRRIPSSFAIFRQGIMRAAQQSPLHFKRMKTFSWRDEGTYYVLLLDLGNHRIVRFGVPDPLIRAKIEAILQENGVEKTLANPISTVTYS